MLQLLCVFLDTFNFILVRYGSTAVTWFIHCMDGYFDLRVMSLQLPFIDVSNS